MVSLLDRRYLWFLRNSKTSPPRHGGTEKGGAETWRRGATWNLSASILPRNRLSHMIPGMIRSAIFIVVSVILAAVTAPAQNSQLKNQVDAVFPDAQTWYLDLHQHPELSSHETRTSAALAEHLRKLGYDVTENVGGTEIGRAHV